MSKKNLNIITIDGPAGSGKSTVARHIADKLGWAHLNTGAIYRAFALLLDRFFTEGSQNLEDLTEEIILKIIVNINSFYSQDDIKHKIFLKSEDITAQLHSPKISQLASVYAQNELVRKYLLPIQRKLVEKYEGVVVDGRDMGTVVFPVAPLKIYLTANSETRARRRLAELQMQNVNVNFDTLLKDLEERDLRDSTRKIAPSKPADDAIIIDSSSNSIDDVVTQILHRFNQI